VTGRTPFNPVWRGADNFAALRASLREHINKEQTSIEEMRAEWTQVLGKASEGFRRDQRGDQQDDRRSVETGRQLAGQ